MSAGLRIVLSTLPLVAGIAWGWSFLMQGLGQGSTYAVAGWYATLLGLFVIVMALAPAAAGLAGSMLLAAMLRVRGAACGPGTDGGRADAVGAVSYLLATVAAGACMWRLSPPHATEYAHYGAAFAWVTALLVLSLCPVAGVLAARIVTRRLPAW